MSLSYHIFIAPDAPAPTDIHNIERKKKKGCISEGANNIPQIEVNTARDITLGFKSEMKSSTELSTLAVPFSEWLYFTVFVCKVIS